MKQRVPLLDMKEIMITDVFWKHYLDLVELVILPYQWKAINDMIPEAPLSHSIENFQIAAKEVPGPFYGEVFQDSDVYKWLEAAAYILAQRENAELLKKTEEVVKLIVKAQCSDGYINTYFILHPQLSRFTNLMEGHELYCAGHLIEAAVAYHYATGCKTILEVAVKLANLVCSTFGPLPEQKHGYPGHQEIELALVKLYILTEDDVYLREAKYFLDVRGTGDNIFLKEQRAKGFQQIFSDFADYDPQYSQSDLPVREQKKAEGHAVRAVYMYSAMADVANYMQDTSLENACCVLWDDIVERQMYLTGSIGSSGILERFTCDYDLPNDRNYSESCASIGLMKFGLSMVRLTHNAKYADIIELALYNTVLAGVAVDGESFFYVNPLEVIPEHCLAHTSLSHVKPVRQKWFGVACCPPNIARTIAELGSYIYSLEKDTILVNLFVDNKVTLPDGSLLELQTEYPRTGKISIKITSAGKIHRIGIRIPSFVSTYQVKVDEKPTMENCTTKGYCFIDVQEQKMTSIEVSFALVAEFIHANLKVSSDVGKVAIRRGPQIFCFEEIDNGGNLACNFVDTSVPIKESYDAVLGIEKLTIKGYRRCFSSSDNSLYTSENTYRMEPIELVAVPYYFWCNRSPGEMTVWIKEVIRF